MQTTLTIILSVLAILAMSYILYTFYVNRKFFKIINSNLYKYSDYSICEINGKFAVKQKTTNCFIDTKEPDFIWNPNDALFFRCLTSKNNACNIYKIITHSNKIVISKYFEY